jgi:acetamidase/formamidase
MCATLDGAPWVATTVTCAYIDLLVTEKELSRDDAYILCGLAGDLHVTQAVDVPKAST